MGAAISDPSEPAADTMPSTMERDCGETTRVDTDSVMAVPAGR